MFGVLRTLLAINVVLLHIFNVPTLGNYSVSFFFVLSGFLMTYIMHHTYGYNLKGFKVFWKNRILRLYPLYWTILIITIFLLILLPDLIKHPHMYMPSGFLEWVYNIGMIYPNPVPHYIKPRLVPPSWALTNEIVYYILISLGISKSFKRTLIWLLISIGYFAYTYLFYDIATYRYSAILASSLPFSLGACLFWLNKNKVTKKLNAMFAFVVYGGFIFNAFYLRKIFGETSNYINMALALLLVYICFNIKSSSKMKIWDSYIGRYSYPVYLSHYAVLLFYSATFALGIQSTTFKLTSNGIIPYFLCLLLFCFILVHVVDIPIDKIKKRIKKQIT